MSETGGEVDDQGIGEERRGTEKLQVLLDRISQNANYRNECEVMGEMGRQPGTWSG